MNFGYRDTCLEHETGPRHPESPDRLRAIRRKLKDRYGVRYVEADPAERERILAVHTDEYVDELEEFCASGGGNWDADTVAGEQTWDAALSSAGLAEWAAREAIDGSSGRNAPFSLGRPPGHHAVADDAMGFCFFNNAAVAAQAVLDDELAERVVIFDWDVHHGNGTQDIFYERGDVFYVSIHEEGLYPGTGQIEEIGTGDGEGETLNIPFPPGTDTGGYLTAIDTVIRPTVAAFDPDLVLVSAGFDAHEHDPISRMEVSTEGYGHMADRMRTICDDVDAALGFILEGGYGLDTLSESIRTIHEVFDGYEPAGGDSDIHDAAEQVLETVRSQPFEGL